MNKKYFILIILVVNVLSTFAQKKLNDIVFGKNKINYEKVNLQHVFKYSGGNYIDSFFIAERIDSIVCRSDMRKSFRIYEIFYQKSYNDTVYNKILNTLKNQSEYLWFEFKPGAFVMQVQNKLIIIRYSLCAFYTLRMQIYKYLKSETYYKKKLIINCGYYDYEEL